MKKSKNSYHTTLIFKTQLNLLTPRERKAIPKSTQQDWKKRNLSKIVGFDEDPNCGQAELFQKMMDSQNFKKVLRSIFRVYSFYASLVENLRGKRRIWNEQKQKIISIIQSISPAFGVKRSCQLMKISLQRYYRWKNEVPCNLSPLALCRKKNQRQLSSEEQKTISSYVKNPQFGNWPLRSIFYKILNDENAFFSISTFYKYVRILFPFRKIIRKQKHKIGIRANSSLQLLHMDTTLLRTLDGSRVYIHFIMDNFSRAILGWKTSLQWNSKNTMLNLKEVCHKFDLFYKPLHLLCDDGSENAGAVNNFLLEPGVSIRKLTAQVDIIFSNSMIEAVNKKMKYEFLFPSKPFSIQDVQKTLEKAVPEFNSRPNGVLFGFTPNEVLAGAIPDKFRFSTQIKDAATKRVQVNQNNHCHEC
ncbi:transposase [Leptospira perolatii]|uniref:Transposase n=1 Tax=Leptospira perolatii TaxID=2023191 RepID=A0A2M9ZSH0_9LEPT|nr:DDE-type integrase/transposase/recombinase [Leptospira perolatii]PJZ71481.1 transposase [Leptospira perolatii]PJZ75016.1 transposase [Leptospira perolatii]